MPVSGMDVAGVRAFATRLQHGADELRAVATRLTGQLNQVPWRGPDQVRFAYAWNSQYVRSLSMAATALSQAAARARRQADQQEQASS